MDNQSQGSKTVRSITSNEKSKGLEKTGSSRFAGLVPVTVGTFLVVGFFLAHQLWSTRFFTTAFGPAEIVLFYASILYGIVTTSSAIFFREDRAIILQLVGAVLWTVTTVWLYVIFPFNFTHVADVVPGALQFLLSWITQGIGRIIWAIVTIGSAAFVPFFILQYQAARRKMKIKEVEIQ